ncbi:MAG: threonine--tRNA ligase [Methanocalculaceae archaeon]|jgi:threonyl-tRNA synthetase|nr:threonine--tRNA ligase [Methanocalculaceae archaeon]
MRILLIHSDNIEYEVVSKTKMAETEIVPRDAMQDALVAFCSVESIDEEDIDDIIAQAVAEITTVADKIGAARVMIYPYAHLSSDLAKPDIAVTVLKEIENTLSTATSLEVKRAPFGYYKKFTVTCKGHPLSELSRELVPGEGGDAAKKPFKKEITRDWFVLTPDGRKHDWQEYNNNITPFGCLVQKELGTAEPVGGEPIHVEIMRSKELADYEPSSDVGNLRWRPKGKLIRDLLADYVLQLTLAHGAEPVETPVMYDLADPAINEHAAKFGERQYRFKSNNRSMMLRFAACFGMFCTMRDMHISPHNLPMKMYELSTYSFRHEQRGEVIGLKRLRGFTMPDMHSLTADMDQACECFEQQMMIGWQTGEDFNTDLVAVFRCTKQFYDEHGSWVKKIAAMSKKTMLIEILSDRVHYWIAKIDLAAIDSQNRPIENPTVQIDVESAARFHISYRDMANTEIHPPILHCSPTGSLERVLCAILESTGRMQVPMLPVWLSPIQVRVVPVAERHVEAASALMNRLNDEFMIRADVDDRDESMGRKVREAAVEWIPYTVVIGDDEAKSGKYSVSIREKAELNKLYKENLSLEELVAAVRVAIGSKPVRPIYTTKWMSRRARYY